MFIKNLLPLILSMATTYLKSKKNSKVVAFLVQEETQNTVSDFFAAYTSTVAELENSK